ncbi:uncharacterized protein LOC105386511 [Plutella xylostella]|uniref:uncharacterized protein LOC105386511 n=1 Tax=Plutella xylostella TaxID=51655 RepID=UPI0020331B1A|nr:uncharacterized protein LOC105386511 [Plutella xylostella]
MKYHILMGFLSVVAAYPGIIHDEGPQVEEKFDHADIIGESGHQHHIQHEHAKSHQSIKFEHFHPVPVYVKKEHSHLLHHPLEKGKSEQELKQVHPETEHKYGGGLVLEDHRFNTDHFAGIEHGASELGGYGGFEGLKAYSGGEFELHQPSLESEGGHYQFQAEGEGEGYKFEGYN